MGLLKSIGNFLFGKDPDIFDAQGKVMHKMPKKTWDAWQDRIKGDPQNNWRHHKGTLASPSQKKQNL
jgi:hypothetical protein